MPDDDANRLTATAIRALQFSTAKGFGRGYDSAEVDRALTRCAEAVEWLSHALVNAQDMVAELQARLERESSDAVIEHAVNVLTTAQETADKILAQADQQRDRVAKDRQEVLAQAHDAARMLQRDSERRAQQVANAATRRVASLEQQIDRLTMSADAAQQEIDRDAARLNAALEASRTQFDDAVDGILFRVAEEYGHANPLAAQAALARRRTGAAGGRPVGAPRSRRGLKIAGRPADRTVEPPWSDRAAVSPDQSELDNRRQR